MNTEILEHIQNGNVCALCERSLNWLYGASGYESPIALHIHRAICGECFERLKRTY